MPWLLNWEAMQKALLVLPLLLVGLAGCLTDGGPDPETEGVISGQPEFHEAFLAESLIISDVDGGGEPSMGVTPDGTIFTNIFSDVYRSEDNGATWTNLGDPAAPIPNNDPDLAVDRDGVVWESRLYALACNEVSVSQDKGESWSTFPVVCNGPVGDRQYVIPTENCEAFLYWHQVPTFYQTVMRTDDCGTTWLPTGPAETPDHHLLINEGSSWGGGGFYNAVTGSVFMTYTRSPGLVTENLVGQIDDSEHPGFSVTRDHFTWEEGIGPAMDGGRLGLGLVMGAADDAGNIYLTWGEAVETGVEIFVSRSIDDGRTWEDKVRVDIGQGSKVFPAITASGDGKVAIAYYHAPEDEVFPDNVEGSWQVDLAYTTDFSDGTWIRGVLATDVKEGPICISGTTCAGGREFLDYFALDHTPEGHVVSVFNELKDDGLRNRFVRTSLPLVAA